MDLCLDTLASCTMQGGPMCGTVWQGKMQQLELREKECVAV